MVYTLGETVLDVIIKDLDTTTLKAGGSMLNTAVSLGRLGVGVAHISAMAKDDASNLLVSFLNDNGVNSDFIYRDKQIKTSLALAFLDENNNANYSFYKDKLSQEPGLIFPQVKRGDIIHFGSFFCLNHHIRGQLIEFLRKARDIGALIIYDPNFRQPHKPKLKEYLPYIEENIQLAHIVKASEEDLDIIYGISTSGNAWNYLKKFDLRALIYTKGHKGSVLINNTYNIEVDALAVDVLSTIGAGDTYSAGIIYYLEKLFNKDWNRVDLSEAEANEMLSLASKFSAAVCATYDNYLGTEFVKKEVHV